MLIETKNLSDKDVKSQLLLDLDGRLGLSSSTFNFTNSLVV